MTTDSNQSKPLELRFEELVKGIFRAEKLEVIIGAERKPAIDFEINANGINIPVEVKLYRSQKIDTSSLQKSAARLEAFRKQHGSKKAVLVIGSYLDLDQIDALESFPHVVVYDLKKLFSFSQKHWPLFDQLELIIKEATPFSSPPTLLSLATAEPLSIYSDLSEKLETNDLEKDSNRIALPAEPQQGKLLCSALRAVPPGKENSKKFEEEATKALKFIFEKDLTAWSTQHHTETNISIYDLVARVNSENDFWKTVVGEFRSRYIIFEFKNYKDEIKQGQIYTTEKYLYATALRATAIIVSPKGADTNAHAAIRGALREQGKLILILTVDDICTMLHLRDQGGEHNDILIERLDSMLMSLER